MSEALGRAVRKARADRRMTQDECAEACDISTGAWRNLERGDTSRPRVATAQAVDELFGWPEGTTRDLARGRIDVAPAAVEPEPAEDHRPAIAKPLRSVPTPAYEDHAGPYLVALREVIEDLDEADAAYVLGIVAQMTGGHK